MIALSRAQIAWRAARELQEGWYVNLGIGMPLQVADFLPADCEVWLQSENGVIGVGPRPAPGAEDPDLINAGKDFVTLKSGGTFCSQVDAFAMIRGGHLDAALIGGFEVSAAGDLANWKLPTRQLGNVGGAMDLATGAQRVFVLMEHRDAKTGRSKLVDRCTYPITAQRCVHMVFTDLGVVAVGPDGFHLLELAPGVTLTEIQSATDAPLQVDPECREIDVSDCPVFPGGGDPVGDT